MSISKKLRIMKIKMKHIFLQTCLLAGGIITFSSCNDFLDMAPLDQVTPQEYFQNADHLAAYSIQKYNSVFSYHAGWGVGTIANDGGTDNMVAGNYSSYYEKNNRYVPEKGGGWDFSNIRYCNYFFEQVLPKYEAGSISGSEADIKHYIGEMYFMRAWIYFDFLKSFGDYPIITEVLPDNKDVLMEKTVRQPRNQVARFILSDLDKAAEYMHDMGFANNNRLNKQVALLIKSRVALYEATFEKYHQGTGRVPGDANWPGKKVHPDFTLDVASEINYFLDQALSAAEAVADKITLTQNTGVMDPTTPTLVSGFNPYSEMFGAKDMSSYSEILFWKAYEKSGNIAISHGTPAWIASGANNGVLKSYVESFLMKDGMPWYAATATTPYKGDVTIKDVKANRDERLQLFLFGEDNFLPLYSNEPDDTIKYFAPIVAPSRNEMKDQTGYRIRKCESFDKSQNVMGKTESTTGCIIFRGVEAHLNYIEAYYLKNGSVNGKADTYWRAIRSRAGIDPDYNKTIVATNMAQETDWGKYSGGTLVDPTLLNIRRERRCEFIGEGMRWDDLIRWRAMDQLMTQKYIPEGCNFWDKIYEYANKDENGNEIDYQFDGKTGSNVSSKELSKYLRPYCIVKDNNPVYEGYTWTKAYYLRPVPVREIELLSPDENVDTSVLYQNPYWPNEINGTAIE